MIINFPIQEGAYGEYCPECHEKNTLTPVVEGERKVFVCSSCQARNERSIIIDPKIRWWVDENRTYYHESAGILLVNPAHKLLFFELTKFPYGLTAPAGHVDVEETPLEAVVREAGEEVGVAIAEPRLLVETMIHGDSCRRGCDDHKWSLYMKRISQAGADSITVDEAEGQKPRWIDLAEVDGLEVPYAMRFLFDNYKKDIEEALETL